MTQNQTNSLPYSNETYSNMLNDIERDIAAFQGDTAFPFEKINDIRQYIIEIDLHITHEKAFKSLSGHSYNDEMRRIHQRLTKISENFELGYSELDGEPGSVFSARESSQSILELLTAKFFLFVKSITSIGSDNDRIKFTQTVNSLYDPLFDTIRFMHNLYIANPLPLEEPKELEVPVCLICHLDLDSEMEKLENQARREMRTRRAAK
jgi:hypothetical protein